MAVERKPPPTFFMIPTELLKSECAIFAYKYINTAICRWVMK